MAGRDGHGVNDAAAYDAVNKFDQGASVPA